MRPVIDLSSARLETDPYPFSVAPNALCADVERATLSWFEQAARWDLTEESFYSQHEFDMHGVELPPDIARLAADSTLATLRERVAALFQRRLRPAVDLTAHRLTLRRKRAVEPTRPGPNNSLQLATNSTIRSEKSRDRQLAAVPEALRPTSVHRPPPL